MFSNLWEISVCLLESLITTYLFYKKIGVKPNQAKRVVISILATTSIVSIFTIMNMPLFVKMLMMLLVYILVALWAFDCNKKGNRHKAVMWASCTLIIVTVADYITYSIALVMVNYPLDKLVNFSSARIQFTLIYLLLVALMVVGLTHFGERDPQLPLFVSIVVFFFIAMGIFTAETIIDIALVLKVDAATMRYAHTLSLLGYCILLILFALLVSFEYLGAILRKNRELKQQHQIAQIEEQQYQFMLSTAESLSEWKHDYKGQLRLISALIEEENFAELKQFIYGVDAELSSSANLIFTGNRTIDAVISLRIMDAKRHQIPFESKLYLPDGLPLHEVAFSSLLGNILDNALEACLKVDSDTKKIFFEIKPWKRMLYIFCSNTSDGNYVIGNHETLLTTKKTQGHGIGMRRIREIVEEAGGTCQFSPQANQFSVSVMIPLKEDAS